MNALCLGVIALTSFTNPQSNATPVIKPIHVFIVAEEFDPKWREGLALNAQKSKKVQDPLGSSYRVIDKDQYRFIIDSRFLMEERYDLAAKALARLDDVRHSDGSIDLNEEPIVRSWLSRRGGASLPEGGTAPENTPSASVLTGATLTLEANGKKIQVTAYSQNSGEAPEWPILSPPKRGAEQKSDPDFVTEIRYLCLSFRQVEDLASGISVGAELLKQWHKEHMSKLKRDNAAILEKLSQESLKMFAGANPEGRAFSTLTPTAQSQFKNEIGISMERYGMKSPEQIEAFLANARVTSFKPELAAFVPVYSPEGRRATQYPIILP